jgi:hypothetical protein
MDAEADAKDEAADAADEAADDNEDRMLEAADAAEEVATTWLVGADEVERVRVGMKTELADCEGDTDGPADDWTADALNIDERTTPGVYDGTTPGVDIGITPGVKAGVWTTLSATTIDAAVKLVVAETGTIGVLGDADAAEDTTSDGALLITGIGAT